MTDNEITELLNSNDGMCKAFEGLEYYDALRLATATSKVLHSGMELTEKVCDNVKNLLSDDNIIPSVRYWLLKCIIVENGNNCTDAGRERSLALLKGDMYTDERDMKIMEDVVTNGFGTRYDSNKDTFISCKNEIDGFRYALMREFPHEYNVEKLIGKMKDLFEKEIVGNTAVH